MNLTYEQATTVAELIRAGAQVNQVVTHPYSGVATMKLNRDTVAMIDRDGAVTYQPGARV